MAILDMTGPFALTGPVVDLVVRQGLPGNYALGYDSNGTYIVRYVGRSYSYFMYSYASSPKSAFEKECKNYHDFGGSESLDNEQHPDRPDGTDWTCQFCNEFD